jgi:hypothetical protein
MGWAHGTRNDGLRKSSSALPGGACFLRFCFAEQMRLELSQELVRAASSFAM